MSREVCGSYGRHYRLCPHEATVIEMQPGPRRRWRTFAEYHTEAEARGALAQLGRLQDATQPDAGFDRSERTEFCTLCNGTGRRATGLLCPSCRGTGTMLVVVWSPRDASPAPQTEDTP